MPGRDPARGARDTGRTGGKIGGRETRNGGKRREVTAVEAVGATRNPFTGRSISPAEHSAMNARDQARKEKRDMERGRGKTSGRTTSAQATGLPAANQFDSMGSGFGTGTGTQGPTTGRPQRAPTKESVTGYNPSRMPPNADVPKFKGPQSLAYGLAAFAGAMPPGPTTPLTAAWSQATGSTLGDAMGLEKGAHVGGTDVDRDTNRNRYGGGGAGAGAAMREEQRRADEERKRRLREQAQQTALGAVGLDPLGPGVLPI